MLFISRRIGYGNYGIVDTDDGVEEIAGVGMIARAITSGVEIQGVTVVVVAHSMQGALVDDIRPYQLPSELTQLQAKVNLLKKVEVTTYHSAITSIRLRSKEIQEPVVLRLSDFGNRCMDCVLQGNIRSGQHKLTLILDNKIELEDIAFCLPSSDNGSSVGVHGVGVKFDVREVRYNRVVENVYRAVYAGNSLELWDTIIDSERRKARMLRMFNGRK